MCKLFYGFFFILFNLTMSLLSKKLIDRVFFLSLRLGDFVNKKNTLSISFPWYKRHNKIK